MNKTILVTGANGNLGQAVTQKFLDEGCKVIGIAAPGTDPEFMKSANLEVHQADLMDEDKTFEAIENVAEIDGAVLTVGGFGMGSFENTSLDQIDKMYRLNFTTAYNSSRAIFKKLKSKGKGGQIVLIGARPALDPSAAKGVVAYGFSKRLVQYLSDIINEETKDTGITSSVIMPSLIDTPPNREAMPDADFDKWVKPETIAANIQHLFTEPGKALRETVLKVYNES
ncbi:MAG: SDR family NAD(P)-dependent oxidoreductase [Bacteroidales bacterium]|nr:SDR family NAD(P)-dependent oxidoreductase [Bacteroidales bacterium]MCF8337549.1 SDR family NAD(P)-dependent oxidoreductase [Bacteroidales bacterium]